MSNPDSQPSRAAGTSRLALSTLVVIPLLTACSLPLGAAAPQSATTLGKGHLGGSFRAQWPDVDPNALSEPEAGASFGTGQAPMSFEGAFGVTDGLDVEFSLDGAFVYILPLPMGASAGARLQLVESDLIDAAIATRVGYMGVSQERRAPDGTRRSEALSALYGSVSAVTQLQALGPFKPGLSISVMPVHVTNEWFQEMPGRFTAMAGTATLLMALDFGIAEVTPFFAWTYLVNPAGNFHHPQIGLSFAVRQEKSKRPPPQSSSRGPPPGLTGAPAHEERGPQL